jgi:hypothetical protein
MANHKVQRQLLAQLNTKGITDYTRRCMHNATKKKNYRKEGHNSQIGPKTKTCIGENNPLFSIEHRQPSNIRVGFAKTNELSTTPRNYTMP